MRATLDFVWQWSRWPQPSRLAVAVAIALLFGFGTWAESVSAGPLPNPAVIAAATAFPPFPPETYVPTNVFDNNSSTEYASDDLGTDTFIDFDFGSVVSVGGFDMQQRHDQARVLTSALIFDDASDFATPLAVVNLTHTDATAAIDHFTFTAVNARFVRWDVSSTNSAGFRANGAAEMTFLTNVCGDGVVDPGEQCDDGNTLSGDCCSPTCQIETAATRTLDSDGNSGNHTGLAIGTDGFPIISHYAITHDQLRATHCSDAACASSTTTVVDGTGGEQSAIAIGAGGLPFITHQTNSSILKLARCLLPDCSTGAVVTEIDHPGGSGTGESNDITVTSAGTPVITWGRPPTATNGLWAGICENALCTSFDGVRQTTNSSDEPTGVTIAGDGKPLIIFRRVNGGTNSLNIAYCADEHCSSSMVQALQSGNAGAGPSIATGADGNGIIAYQDTGSNSLKVIHCTNVSCQNSAPPVVLDASGTVGQRPSITIGADGKAVIAYYDQVNGDLKLAHCVDTACNGAFITTLDSANDVGKYPSIGVAPSGQVYVSYRDATAAALKVAMCPSAVCGNGIVEAGEQCDDGNTSSGDCCSAQCQYESNGSACGSDGNGCTDDVCNTTGTCTHPNNTASCSDGLFCNGLDTCDAGSCSVHAGDPCPGANGDGNCSESCNEMAEDCTAADPDGAGCNDGFFCTSTDICSGGVCVGSGNPCPGPDGDGNCSESCNEAADDCNAADPDGSACSDGLYCTGVDTCSSGACATHSGDPCNAGPECNNVCNEAVGNCLVAGGTACTDDGSTCTADACNGSGGCAHSVVVERHDCGNCADGVDSDVPADGLVDAEDPKCATLAALQSFAVISSATIGRDELFFGGDVNISSAAGSLPMSLAPYPVGASLAGVCGNDMAIRAGGVMGMLMTQFIDPQEQVGVTFGDGETGGRIISIAHEYGSNGGPESFGASAPFVGPGQCPNTLEQCSADAECAAQSCFGRGHLDDALNPYVSRDGMSANFIKCQTALSELIAKEQSIATIPGNVTGYSAADAASVKTSKSAPLLTVPVGGGLQVLELGKVLVKGNTELRFAGQADTILVLRVKKGLKLGGLAKVSLQGILPEHVLWNLEGTKGGGVKMKQGTEFVGTVLAPERKSGITLGAEITVHGALYAPKVHLDASVVVEHRPFTGWVQ